MDILEASQDLVKEITDVIVAEMLSFQELVEVSLHKILHNVSVNHVKANQLTFYSRHWSWSEKKPSFNYVI